VKPLSIHTLLSDASRNPFDQNCCTSLFCDHPPIVTIATSPWQICKFANSLLAMPPKSKKPGGFEKGKKSEDEREEPLQAVVNDHHLWPPFHGRRS
jgi:hypothetical protein